MENAGEVITSTVAVPIQETVGVAGETITSAAEPVVESVDTASPIEIPIEGLSEEPEGLLGYEEDLQREDNPSEISEDAQIEDARNELKEIEEEQSEEQEGENESSEDEQLATLNETIRLLEVQRDALREQLGGGSFALIGEIVKYFISNSITDEPISETPNNTVGPSEAWKESARTQLRKIEVKISDLKKLRERLVAKKSL